MTIRLLGRRSGLLFAGRRFSPTDIPGGALQLWLRADVGVYQDAARTTPAVADGDPVGGWADQSGQGNHASQATAGNKPLLKLNIVNGRSVLRFDGVDDYLTCAAFSAALTQPYSGVESHSLDGLPAVAALVYGEAGVARIFAGTALLSSTVAPTAFSIWSTLFSGAASSIWTNGVQTALGNAGTASLTQVTIGWDNAHTVAYNALCDIDQIMVFNRALTTSERQQLERYLGSLYAISVP